MHRRVVRVTDRALANRALVILESESRLVVAQPSAAASQLRIDPSTLLGKVKALGIELSEVYGPSR